MVSSSTGGKVCVAHRSRFSISYPHVQDVCTYGPSPGAPENAIEEVLRIKNVDDNEIVFQYIVQYTSVRDEANVLLL